MKTLPNLAELHVLTVPTKWGWIAAVGQDRVLHFVTIGHESPAAAIGACAVGSLNDIPEPNVWHPELKHRLRAYATGKHVDFSDIKLELSHLTPFQQKIVKCCRRIPYGETLSYGELAAKANSPRAARAVGTVMAKNRFPLIVPCHRVVAAGGKLGGFSARSGVTLKQHLLDLESSVK